MNTYKNCKKLINAGAYGSYDAMMSKLDLFLLMNRLTEEQYTELVELLNEKEGITPDEGEE